MPSNRQLSSLFRRCLQCPNETPSCPSCARDETCLLQSQSCDACRSARCVPVGSLPGQSEAPRASSTPAIAGGVVGGVVFIILITILIWWFCIRKRRQEWDDQVWTDTDQSIKGVEKRDQSALNREARESTRSMGSIASTVRTRASNVIQIAYIPGVTNRSPTESPGLLPPPVPTIPLGTANNSAATSPNFEQDRHFFMPNLRDSSYSDLSAGRQSLSPSLARASNATTIYRSHAEVSPRPAVQALLGRAAVVTVNKSGNNSPDTPTAEDTAVPTIPQSQKGMMNSPIVARNVTARPIQVKKSNSGKKAQIPTLANLQAASANRQVSLRAQPDKTEDRSEDEADASTHLMSSNTTPTTRPRHQSTVETIIEDTPALKQSHFSNTTASSSSSVSAISAPSTTSPLRVSNPRTSRAGSRSSVSAQGSMSAPLHKKSGSVNSLIEEAMAKAARDPIHGGLGSIDENHQNHPMSRGSQGHGRSDSASTSGPFSDANELRESNR